MFNLAEKFSLFLKWERVKYDLDGVCELVGAYFSGPVLQIAQVIEANDNIVVDFYSQYLHLVESAFMGQFSWGVVEYVDDGKKVLLRDAYIRHATQLNKVPQLNNDDWLLIDTSKHSVDAHRYNLVYTTYVMRADKDLHKFGAK